MWRSTPRRWRNTGRPCPRCFPWPARAVWRCSRMTMACCVLHPLGAMPCGRSWRAAAGAVFSPHPQARCCATTPPRSRCPTPTTPRRWRPSRRYRLRPCRGAWCFWGRTRRWTGSISSPRPCVRWARVRSPACWCTPRPWSMAWRGTGWYPPIRQALGYRPRWPWAAWPPGPGAGAVAGRCCSVPRLRCWPCWAGCGPTWQGCGGRRCPRWRAWSCT